jgi:RNA polymerase sigma-70 factor (ECF subfamily)
LTHRRSRGKINPQGGKLVQDIYALIYMESSTSLSLLERLKSSQDAVRDPAWCRFVFLYTPLLMRWAQKQGFQEAEAADLTQDAFIKLMSSLPHYTRQPGSSFRGWLMTLLRNLGHDYRRRRSTREWASATPLEDQVGHDPWVDIEESEFRQWLLHRGLNLIRDEFSEQTWRAFEGVVVHSRTAQAVGQELGMSPNAVYLARHRVLARLREELKCFVEDA